MKSKEIFSLAVRLLGLVFLYHGLQILPSSIVQVIGSLPHVQNGQLDFNFAALVTGIVMAGWPLGLAYWLVRGAPTLMRMAYPEKSPNTGTAAQIDGMLPSKADA